MVKPPGALSMDDIGPSSNKLLFLVRPKVWGWGLFPSSKS